MIENHINFKYTFKRQLLKGKGRHSLDGRGIKRDVFSNFKSDFFKTFV